jgi:hypothetical protein
MRFFVRHWRGGGRRSGCGAGSGDWSRIARSILLGGAVVSGQATTDAASRAAAQLGVQQEPSNSPNLDPASQERERAGSLATRAPPDSVRQRSGRWRRVCSVTEIRSAPARTMGNTAGSDARPRRLQMTPDDRFLTNGLLRPARAWQIPGSSAAGGSHAHIRRRRSRQGEAAFWTGISSVARTLLGRDPCSGLRCRRAIVSTSSPRSRDLRTARS